jgi:trimeric autotransporter adhesin
MRTTISIPILFGVVSFIFFTQISYTAYSQNIDFGKSYINVTKGVSGGTVEPGDVLEIRASIVVRSGAYDSCGYFDAVPAGTSFIPGTIRVLTNEGKIYKQFTDAIGDDAGWISGSNIRINLGFNTGAAPATAFRRGRIANNHRPSFYGGTCIMIASFRVTVTAAYGSNLSLGGGSMSYLPSSGGVTSFIYPGRSVAVFRNYGICPNAVGANSIGTEFNGTFGSGKPRNRGASANVPSGYTYNIFTSNMPNDYYYGIPNNTSINTGYTTSNTWPKPDASHRVFGVWDIIGDHTGATNPLLGNSAADTVANSNAGYMLVINAAYRIDSAFQQTISGLCPNTYYEISVWMRNICSRCGCDSAGRGAGSAGYIPTAAGDSSGVYPNLSFNVNGIDYYTTGNILYTGEWIKKGFTFLTGPSQTSFTLKIFNNAPGGGGNDWALDDISVATCSPNLAFTPSNNPTVCVGNVVDLGAWIRSYFNNYIYYKWQRSTNNGLSWVDASSVGTGSPIWNGSNWEYYTAYPSFVSTSADSGTKFRVVVASTAANISNPSCSFADVTSILTLNVINCSFLNTDIVSFSGRADGSIIKLNWTSSREEGAVQYIIEKSSDGKNFTSAGSVQGLNSNNEVNYYSWSENYLPNQTLFYRVRLVTADRQKISRTVKIISASKEFEINIINPFTHSLMAEVTAAEPQLVFFKLIDNSGRILREEKFALTTGTNSLQIANTGNLPKGLYTLQIQSGAKLFVSKKVLKL